MDLESELTGSGNKDCFALSILGLDVADCASPTFVQVTRRASLTAAEIFDTNHGSFFGNTKSFTVHKRCNRGTVAIVSRGFVINRGHELMVATHNPRYY